MSKVVEEVLAANRRYAGDFGSEGRLALPPARGFAILTCMDARIDPAKLAGLSEGDAHVIRNAGGRASDDAIRSLVISHKLLGTPLVSKEIPIYGYIYQVESGRLVEVPEASAVGQAS